MSSSFETNHREQRGEVANHNCRFVHAKDIALVLLDRLNERMQKKCATPAEVALKQSEKHHDIKGV